MSTKQEIAKCNWSSAMWSSLTSKIMWLIWILIVSLLCCMSWFITAEALYGVFLYVNASDEEEIVQIFIVRKLDMSDSFKQAKWCWMRSWLFWRVSMILWRNRGLLGARGHFDKKPNSSFDLDNSCWQLRRPWSGLSIACEQPAKLMSCQCLQLFVKLQKAQRRMATPAQPTESCECRPGAGSKCWSPWWEKATTQKWFSLSLRPSRCGAADYVQVQNSIGDHLYEQLKAKQTQSQRSQVSTNSLWFQRPSFRLAIKRQGWSRL